jgi:hypothetical protein
MADDFNTCDTAEYDAANVDIVAAAESTDALMVRESGSDTPRFLVNGDGKLEWAASDGAPTNNLYRTFDNKLATDQDLTCGGDFSLTALGKTIKVKEGSNAKMGATALTAGAATVSTTAVTASSRIFLTCNTPGGTPGFLRVSARTAGTSFTITSSSGSDTSTVAWLLLEPA